VALTPARYGFWQNLADAYHWSASEPRARESYERTIDLVRATLEMNPRDAPARSRLAICFARTGRAAAAREEIRKATELAAQNPQVMYNAAIVAHIAGEKREALTWIASAAAAGFGAEQIRREPEFADLRKEDAFEKALQGNQKRGS
jgi:Flp pilus assembly protein TadD